MITRAVLLVLAVALAGCASGATATGDAQQQCAAVNGIWRGDHCERPAGY